MPARPNDEQRPVASLTKLLTAITALESLELDDTVGRWLDALLIDSANEAAIALAEASGVADFPARMTAVAAALGATGTVALNPHGLDQEGAWSTANDVALIMRAALADERLTARLTTRAGEPLPGQDGVFSPAAVIVATKTGFTTRAGLSLASLVDVSGERVIVVVLGSDNPYLDTVELASWAAG